MGKLILVTGGARSGKSTFAESLAKSCGKRVLYIATAAAYDSEMKERIRLHQLQRPPDWETLEVMKDIAIKAESRIAGKDAVLLDCITLLVTNLMMDSGIDWAAPSTEHINSFEETVKKEIASLVETAGKSPVPLIAVTNEVGMGLVPEYPSGRVFRDVSGRANQLLAAHAEEVFLCVSGIPVRIK